MFQICCTAGIMLRSELTVNEKNISLKILNMYFK